MKKFIYAVLFSLSATLLFGQEDPSAKDLLNKVSQRYETYRTLRSDFTLLIKDVEGKSYTNSGTLLLNKPANQYRISLANEDILSDGKSVWNITKELKEVQVTIAEEKSTTIGPNNLFTFYQTGYKYVSMPDEKISKDSKTEMLKVIELSPLDTKNNYFKIKLRINKNNHIHDITIFDKSGNRYTYTIHTLYVNHPIAKSNFEFKKEQYKGFEIVDLR